jgi:hypothetical protein
VELRLDRLLAALRADPTTILEAIDTDPLLLRREIGGLILANARKALYTPQQEHQLFAKGIVYRRDPFRLVSLPLIKIYNAGERAVGLGDLAQLSAEPGMRLRFLQKVDGSLVQVFRAEGRVWFSTRGLLEGLRPSVGEDDEDGPFDFIGTARRLAAERYPRLLSDETLLAGRTLIFELIHPGARKVTDYGHREDLVLLAAFDHRQIAYLAHDDLTALGSAHGLTPVEALSPRGTTLAEQVEDLLASLAGTDQEGSVLAFERDGTVVYRVKIKSPDYLKLVRLLASCTYPATAEMLDAHPEVTTWPEFEAFLQSQGRDRVPEEVLGYFRPHFDTHLAYLAGCQQLRQETLGVLTRFTEKVEGAHDPKLYRKAFAARVVGHPLAPLLFTALDGRLDLERVRRHCKDLAEVRQVLATLNSE